MKAPRLVTRALVTSFLTVALVLGAVFALLSLRVREQVREAVASNLASAQQVFTQRGGAPAAGHARGGGNAGREPDVESRTGNLAHRARRRRRAHQPRVTGHGAAGNGQDRRTHRGRCAGRGRRPRPHRRQQRAAGAVVASRRENCRSHRNGGRRSHRRDWRRDVPHHFGAAAVRRGHDRVARARHGARCWLCARAGRAVAGPRRHRLEKCGTRVDVVRSGVARPGGVRGWRLPASRDFTRRRGMGAAAVVAPRRRDVPGAGVD